MAVTIFSFAQKRSAVPVTVHHFHRPELSSAAGGALNVIPPSHANAPSRLRGTAADSYDTIDESLFANRAELKIMISEVAMHLLDSRRADLFKQIDELLFNEDWTDEDQLIQIQSFRTFLRFLIYYHNVKRPSLTVTSAGNIAASWFADGERLTVEFLSQDLVRLVMYRVLDAGRDAETVAYQGPMRRIETVVGGFGQMPWDHDVTA